MSWLFNWIIETIPWYVWAIAAAAGLFAAYRFLGLRGMLAAAVAILTLGAYRMGRKTGGEDALARQKKADEKAVKDHDKIEAETDRMSDAELDAANNPFVRKSGRKR